MTGIQYGLWEEVASSQHMPQNFQCIRCTEAKWMVHALLERTKRENHEVFGKGRGEVVHYQSDCPRLTGGSNQYLQCMVCRDMIRRRWKKSGLGQKKEKEGGFFSFIPKRCVHVSKLLPFRVAYRRWCVKWSGEENDLFFRSQIEMISCDTWPDGQCQGECWQSCFPEVVSW